MGFSRGRAPALVWSSLPKGPAPACLRFYLLSFSLQSSDLQRCSGSPSLSPFLLNLRCNARTLAHPLSNGNAPEVNCEPTLSEHLSRKGMPTLRHAEPFVAVLQRWYIRRSQSD